MSGDLVASCRQPCGARLGYKVSDRRAALEANAFPRQLGEPKIHLAT